MVGTKSSQKLQSHTFLVFIFQLWGRDCLLKRPSEGLCFLVHCLWHSSSWVLISLCPRIRTSGLCPEVPGVLNLRLLWTLQNSLPGTNTENINAPSCKSRLRGESPAGNLAQSASVWAQAEGSICCTQLSALWQGQRVGLAGFMGSCYVSFVRLGPVIASDEWRWTKSPLWKERELSAWERVPSQLWKTVCQASDSKSARLSPGPCHRLHHPITGIFKRGLCWK